MEKPILSAVFSVLCVCFASAGCSSSSEDGGSDDEGGGGSGGPTGGAASGRGGAGAATGGAATGGTATGGIATGGASSGGAASGGSATGGASTGGSGGSGGCDAACARVVGAACGTTTQAECVEGCASLTTSCPAEVPAYVECVSNPANAITCDTAAMAAEIAGCDGVIQDLNACGICVPAAGDLACGTCSRGSCCDELQAYVSAADVAVFDACVTPCADSACVDACAATSPIAGAAYEAVSECQLGTCGEECVCEASAEDTTCVACLKVSCCGDLVPYVGAEDIDGFAACIEPCAEQACVDTCINDFPDAGAAYDLLITCAQGSCVAECSQ